jgi:hypothetical protein
MDGRVDPTDDGDAQGKPRLQLPASCDPPPVGGPTKQLIWIVRYASPRLLLSTLTMP